MLPKALESIRLSVFVTARWVNGGGSWVTRETHQENPQRKPPGQRPTEEVDRCVPQELSLDCCLENERVLGHTGRLLVDIHLLCWGLLGVPGVHRP